MARVVPKPGVICPMPDGRNLPADGADVTIEDLFWQRRLADGDVVLQEEAAADEPAAAAAADPAPRPSKKG